MTDEWMMMTDGWIIMTERCMNDDDGWMDG